MSTRDTDPTDLSAVEDEQAMQERVARERHDQDVEDLKWLLADKRGRRFFWRLLTLTHVFHTSFRLNSEMAFLEGERNIGLKYWGELQTHAPNAYPQMVKEQRKHG